MFNNYEERLHSGRRRVIRQGGLVKILRAGVPKIQKGGGKRSAQHGHGKRSERRLYNFLLTCKPAKYIIWLTYPHIQGPDQVEKNVKAFLRRLEKHLGFKIGALAKMEIQHRLSPEVSIAVWFAPEVTLEAHAVNELWNKTLKSQGRIDIKKPRNWYKTASYMAKQIIINAAGITIGSKKMGFIEPRASDFIIRAHKDTKKYPEFFDSKYLGQNGAFLMAKGEWITYKGRYYWKHGRDYIPKCPKVLAVISGPSVERGRQDVNAKRNMHFVGPQDYFTLKGKEAIKFVRENETLHTDFLKPFLPLPFPTRQGGPISNPVRKMYLDVCKILMVDRRFMI